MKEKKNLTLKLELFGWLLTAVLVLGALFPIYRMLETNYPFWWTNTICIVVFVTLVRYIFLLKHTFLAQGEPLKIVLFFLCIPLAFYLVNEINYFKTFLDEGDFEVYVHDLSLADRDYILQYIRSEFLFFSVGAVIATSAFAIRMLVSVWRVRNRNTV